MRWALAISLLIFGMIEVPIFRALVIRKEKLAAKSVAISFVSLLLLAVAACIFGWNIPDLAFILAMGSMAVHSYFGYYRNLYNRSRRFDRIAHALGSFSSAILVYYLLSNFFLYGGSRAFQALYVMLLGIALGAVYEIVEFVIDLKESIHMQRGLRDTNLDIIFNIIGSVAAAALAFFVLL